MSERADGSGRWVRTAVVVVCAIVLAGAALRVAVHDPTSEPVSGDQASFVYQALSLRGGDLSYDANDQARWLDLGWADQPHGLFVQQRGDGWAFAKPLGYSVLLAPAIAVGGAHGITLVGAGLLLAYAGCWYALGRRRWDRATALAVATAATVASHAWLFAFPAHADLFVAVLVGVCALAATRSHDLSERSRSHGAPQRSQRSGEWWLVLAAAAAALLVTEKLPALVAVGPLVALAFVRASWRARLVAAGVGAVVLAVSVAPYLYYSDGESWSAYGGDRYYAIATTPWSGGTDADLTPWRTRDSLTPSFVLDQLTGPSGDLPAATLTYAVGRHTGVATFQPIAAALLVAAAVAAVVRRRRSGRFGAPVHEQRAPLPPTSDDGAGDGWVAAAAALGLAGYVGLYLVVFTDNYFGGGQSIGNRYFLQVSVLVAVVVAAAPVSARVARWCAAGAAAWAAVLLGPLLRSPEEAFFHLERTSAAQELLPFDDTQVHAWRFECEPAECVAPPLEAYDQ